MLNNEQRDAVYSNQNKILCLAGAGCGKTHSMIERIVRLVNEGENPASILVLTFTNAAAFEMQTRYLNHRDINPDLSVPNFRTFHSFCYSLIASDISVRSALGYTSLPEIATEAQTKEIEKLAAEQSGIKLSANKLKSASAFTQETLRKTAQRIMIARNLITFDIMCYNVCKLFVKDEFCIKRYKEKYRNIFVDEFQDTDPKQWEFVSSFTDSSIFLVADALQAIYAFRGADSSIVKNIADDREWYKVKLTYNYRSTSQICQFANHHSEHGEESYRVQIYSNKEGDEVVCIPYDQDNTLRNIILTCNRLHVQNGGSCAILCRTNAEVRQVAEWCKRLRIPVVTKDAETDTTIGMLRSVKDDEYAVTWLASKLRTAYYSRYLRRSFLQPYTLDEFQSEYLEDSVNDYLLDRVATIRQWRRELANIKSVEDMQKFIAHVGPKQIDDISNIHKRSELIDALISLYNTETPDNLLSKLYVGTIHSVKGLEYDSVMLLGVGGETFRLTNEENLNLYYVGITRARTHLCIWKGTLHDTSEIFDDEYDTIE